MELMPREILAQNMQLGATFNTSTQMISLA